MIFFAILLFFGTAVQIEKDHASLHPGEQLVVTITADQPAYFFDCVEAVAKDTRYGSFQLQSYKLLAPNRLELTLLPLHLGTLIFAPGLLSLQDGGVAPIPSFEIECQRAFPVPQFNPPQPVRPEEAIQLNDELRARMQQDTALSAALLLEKKERRGKIWTLLFAIFFSGAALVASTLLVDRYMHRRRKERVEKRDWQQELKSLQTADALALLLRDFQRYKKNEALNELIQRLDEDRFSGKSLGQQQLFEYVQKAAVFLSGEQAP